MDIVPVGHIVDIVLVVTNCAHQHSTILCFMGIYIFSRHDTSFVHQFHVQLYKEY